jgi:RNA-directed DNA polymerase
MCNTLYDIIQAISPGPSPLVTVSLERNYPPKFEVIFCVRAVVSPLLANIYLDGLDWRIAKAGLQMVRYADDFVILCRTEQEAQRALALITEWMQGAELTLHPQKTKIVDATQRDGFEFLGYHFERGQKWARKKSEVKVREKLRARTRRNNGQSLKSIITGINPILRGWFNYFQYSKLNALQAMDGWIRGRLRSILRKRTKKKGKAKELNPNSEVELKN